MQFPAFAAQVYITTTDIIFFFSDLTFLFKEKWIFSQRGA